MVSFIRHPIGRYLVVAASVVLAVCIQRLTAFAVDGVNVGAGGCILGQGGHVIRPAGSTITIRWGVFETNKGVAMNYLNAQSTSIVVNGGQPVDVSGDYGAPVLGDGTWTTLVLYPTGVTLANPGDTLTFSILVSLDRPLVEVTNGLDGFTPGLPIFWSAGTYFAEPAPLQLSRQTRTIVGRRGMMKPTLRLSLAGTAVALVALVSFTAIAQATAPVTDANRVKFFACAAATNPTDPSRLVPANAPLWDQRGYSSGSKGLVQSAVSKITNTLEVTYSSGATATFHPTYGPAELRPDGTWTAWLTRIEFGSLAPGESMTIHWTYTVSSAYEDLAPPSTDWAPTVLGLPPYDGTGLLYQLHVDAGTYGNGICTVTAVAS